MSSQDKFMNTPLTKGKMYYSGGRGSYSSVRIFERIKIRRFTVNYNLQIRPAIPIELRHKISDLIGKEGYNVWSQGQFTDESVCDINFDTSDESKKQMGGVEVKEGEVTKLFEERESVSIGKKDSDGHDEMYKEWFICPACDNPEEDFITTASNFCPNCGVRLIWEKG